MNYPPPAPDTAWGRHCPEAFPRDRLAGSTALPDGFGRIATDEEADLICGRVSEAAFLGRKPAPSSPPAQRRGKKKPVNPVVRKLRGYRIFLDGLEDRLPRLTPLAALIWCWLWSCESQGEASTSERSLEKRFGSTRKTIRGRFRELEEAGYLVLRRRGEKRRTSTVYRVHPKPVERGRDDPSRGVETTP